MAGNQEIHVQQALEILARRSEEGRDASENQCPCGKLEIPEGARKMGQTIELMAAGITPPTEMMDEKEHKKVAQEREDRKVELKEKLGTMSTKQLLQTVLDVQEQRVATYRTFDR